MKVDVPGGGDVYCAGLEECVGYRPEWQNPGTILTGARQTTNRGWAAMT